MDNEKVKLIFCTKCKKKTVTNDEMGTYSKNGKFMITGKCVICNTKKQQFARKTEEEGYKSTMQML